MTYMPQYIPHIDDHPAVVKEKNLLHWQQDQYRGLDAAIEELRQRRNVESPLNDIAAAYRRGEVPGRVDLSHGAQESEQLYARQCILAGEIEAQKKVVHTVERKAAVEMVETLSLKDAHQKLLQKAFDSAKSFNADNQALIDFYSELEAKGFGGSMLGHHAFPLVLGSLDDVNSNIRAWIKEVNQSGYKINE